MEGDLHQAQESNMNQDAALDYSRKTGFKKSEIVIQND